MQDTPDPIDLLNAVAVFLRQQAMPQLSGHTAYHARVAANTLDIVIRQLRAMPVDEPAQLRRLQALLAPQVGGEPWSGAAISASADRPRDDALSALNLELCERLRDGRLTLDSPGLADHLWATTMEKLAVDQPRYETYRRAEAANPPSGTPATSTLVKDA